MEGCQVSVGRLATLLLLPAVDRSVGARSQHRRRPHLRGPDRVQESRGAGVGRPRGPRQERGLPRVSKSAGPARLGEPRWSSPCAARLRRAGRVRRRRRVARLDVADQICKFLVLVHPVGHVVEVTSKNWNSSRANSAILSANPL